MGQYHVVVNLDRKEYIDPSKLGDGAKFLEQINGYYLSGMPVAPAALYILLGASAKGKGFGDVPLEVKYKRTKDGYKEIETDPEWNKRVRAWVGRWAGQRVAVIGDYAEEGDIPLNASDPRPKEIYHLCMENRFRDITDEIAPILERVYRPYVSGYGWKRKRSKKALV